MEKKKDLKKRIKELETIVEQQNTLIEGLLLENRNNIFTPIPVQDNCPAGGEHEYPFPWFGTTPPFCKKCGQQAPDTTPTYTISKINKDITNLT